MTNFLEIALRNAARGFRGFPLDPATKQPAILDWPNRATADPATIQKWATKFPQHNYGVAGGPGGEGGLNLAMLDSDHLSRFKELCGPNWGDWSRTFAVGRGDPDRIHLYYLATPEILALGNRKLKEERIGNICEVKVQGGQVVGEGSVHPSGAVYRVVQDLPLIEFPHDLYAFIAELLAKQNPTGKREWTGPIHDGEGREDFLVSEAGRLRHVGCSESIILAHLEELNNDPSVMADPKPQEDLERISRSIGNKPIPPEPPSVTIGGKPEPPKDWRLWFHSFEEMDNAPKPTFLIDGFLQKDVIASIAAPVGQRKTLIAVNVAHALLTGEPLFDHFAVSERPARVLYLCPEMGIRSFTDRIRNLGLLPHVGKTLFCRTMNSEGKLALGELPTEALEGACVIIDTAVRFIQGDENSSEDMRVLAEDCFRLMKAGAASVLVLFHSPKGTKDISELTLENAMRGSGELGAFVSSCWATRLQHPDEPYQSASYLTNVKQRDFESKPFEVTSGPDCRLHIVAQPSANVVLEGKKRGTMGNADGREEEALQVIRDNPTLSHPKIVLKLKARGIQRERSWVGNKKFELLNVGVKTATTP